MLISNSVSDQLKNNQSKHFNPNKDSSKIESKEQFLLTRIAQGNSHVFWQLWLLYEDYLYRRCQQWMGNNPMDAEEALSQARLKAWEKLPNYATKITNPKAWLTRMTHNLCVDIHRNRQKRATNTDLIEQVFVAESNILGADLDSPESEILDHELKIYVRQAINNLPSRLRNPLNLLYYHQMSYEEIAYKLMISKENVYKRISQARNLLKKQLNNYFSSSNNSSSPKCDTQGQINAIRKNKYCQKLGKTEKHFARNTWPVAKQELPDMSISFLAKNSLEIINYEVTALCLERPLLVS